MPFIDIYLSIHTYYAHLLRLTNEWCGGHFLGYTPKLVPPSQSDVVRCARLQSLHIHHISLSSDIASSEGSAVCADLGSEHNGGVTGVFQEHSNTSTAPSGGLIGSHHHWRHSDVGRDCRGRGGGRRGEGGRAVMCDVHTPHTIGKPHSQGTNSMAVNLSLTPTLFLPTTLTL